MKIPSLTAFAFLVLTAMVVKSAVFNIADGDLVGLKAAINTSNTNAEDDTIELATNGNYVLTTIDNVSDDNNGLPVITADGGKTLTIHGNGATIQRSTDAGEDFRIFCTSTGANVTVRDLTIANGITDNDGGAGINNVGAALALTNCVLKDNSGVGGGAIFNDNGNSTATLVLDNCTLSNNSAPNSFGGGIINYGIGGSASLTVNGCTFTNDSASYGGAIVNYAPFNGTASLAVTNSTFTQNSASYGRGGAIYNSTTVNGGVTTADVENSTFNGNSAYFYGGGFANDGGNAQLRDCTFSGNSANSGGAIYNAYDNAVELITNCTISGNTASYIGGCVCNDNPNGGHSLAKIVNTILNAGTTGGTVSGSGITSLGHNLCSDSGGGSLNGTGDQINTDPKLDPNGLKNNGGPTQTISLLANSSAVNAGDDASAPARDQRYYLRNGVSDIGAFEYNGTLAPISVVSRKTHGSAGTFDVNLPLTGAVGIECRSGGATSDYQLVLTFAAPVTVNGIPQAQVTTGTGQVGSGGATNGGVVSVDASGTIVTIPLTNVFNAQRIAVTLFGVNDGSNSSDVNVPMGVLLGDTTANGAVNSSDIAQTQSQSGQLVNSSNFREDVTTNGSINSSDIALVQSKSGTALPAAPSRIDRPIGRPTRKTINAR